ncbi:MAG TPA: zinc-binding dehydrogenase [Acidimicrobiales bacterium]|nr:zinc-binding dehydrogenase [Acidimicrobiales bacterium]
MDGTLLDGTTRFSRNGKDVHQAVYCGTFSEQTVVPAIGAVKIDPDVPLHCAALIGRCVLTGVGAAMNTAAIGPGMSVAIVGCGGVGLNVVQGAKLAGSERIIAIDRLADKLALAERFGATDLVDASGSDPVALVRDLTSGRGVDVTIEAVGRFDTVLAATSMTRRGGQVVLVGLPSPEVLYPLPIASILHSAQRIQGSTYGSSDIRRDVPKLIEFYQQGDLLLDELVSGVLTLDEINDGLDAVERGEVTRSIIQYS